LGIKAGRRVRSNPVHFLYPEQTPKAAVNKMGFCFLLFLWKILIFWWKLRWKNSHTRFLFGKENELQESKN